MCCKVNQNGAIRLLLVVTVTSVVLIVVYDLFTLLSLTSVKSPDTSVVHDSRPCFIVLAPDSQPLQSFQAPVEQEQIFKVPHSCRCDLRNTSAGPITIEQFGLMISWLNITTKRHLSDRHPNLPVNFLYQASGGKACSLVPTISSIEWRNVYWQEVRLDGDTTLQLYSATYDPNTTGGQPCVRILAVTHSTQIPAAWCRYWYAPDQPPVLTRVNNSEHIDYQEKNSTRQMPYLITCPLPPQAGKPVAVSLVRKPCDPATTLLKVAGSHHREPSAYRDGQVPEDPTSKVTGWVPAVCGPALFYYHTDFSKRLVEWLEILRAEGFGRVFLYVTQVHPNIQKVLQYYEKEGFVQVTDYTYPPPYVNEPSIRRLWTLVERSKMFAHENIYFTDCLLRHMHQHRFIAHYDPDEIPILPRHDNFTHFLDEVLTQQQTLPLEKRETPFTYRLAWNYFFSDLEASPEAAKLPSYMWALRHTRRAAENQFVSGSTVKPLFDMDMVRGVFSHSPLICTTGRCYEEFIQTLPFEDAYLGHFKYTCGPSCKLKNATKEELFLLKYKKPVTRAVTRVLRQLGLI